VKEVMAMPSGWMPDARHDRRTAFLFDPRYDAQRAAATSAKRASARRTTHRHSHRPRAIAHG
jgi:hypothetical protein